MKIYRDDDRAPKWMFDAWMPNSNTANCPQCKGEIRWVANSVWRCTSCRIELNCSAYGEILSVRNLQPWHLGPPDILCSQCGVPLVKADDGFRCKPCGREVRA